MEAKAKEQARVAKAKDDDTQKMDQRTAADFGETATAGGGRVVAEDGS